MGAIRKILRTVLVVIVILAGVYTAARGFASWSQSYTWAEMDWNQDGSTSIAEFFMASDIGKRTITKGDQSYIEYFSYKDGLPIIRNP